MEGKTSITIADHLETARNPDVIFALHDGIMSERSTHDELLAREAQYARLFKTQFWPSSDVQPPVAV